MVSVGTNPLPRNGSRIRGMGRLLAVSTLLVLRPNATVSQVIAQETIASTPIAAIHSRAPAVGRNPTSSATPTTTATAIAVCIMAPRTWPVSTEAREMAMVRNREMMPPVMSIATDIAGGCGAERDEPDRSAVPGHSYFGWSCHGRATGGDDG